LGDVEQYYQVSTIDGDNSTYYIANNTDGDGTPREWTNSDMNFDNVYEAFLVLFVSASGEGWPDVMFATCDIMGIDHQPKENAKPYYAYYWVVYVSLVCFFFAELFVGAIFEKFCELKRNAAKTGTALFLTDFQQKWVNHQKEMLKAKPIKPKGCKKFFPKYMKLVEAGKVSRGTMRSKFVIGVNQLRKRAYILCMSEYFSSCIMAFILLNTLTMAMPYYQMGAHMVSFLFISNYLFTFVFIAELTLKVFALSVRGYLADSWNCFDAFVVAGSVLDLIISTFNASIFRVLRIGRAIAKLLRLVRVMRVVRLAKAMEGLQKVIATLWLSIPAMMNIGALLLLLFFIFAVLGTFLFGDLKLEGPHSSFQNFPDSMLTLFRVSTGEDWQNLMYGCYDGEYGQYVAAIYFIVFCFAAGFIILNLFVMIIAENFEEEPDEEEDFDEEEIDKSEGDNEGDEIDLRVHDMRKKFRAAWSRLDPEATAFIHKDKLRALLVDIGPPAGIKGDSTEDAFEKFVVQLQLTKLGEFLNFTDVLLSLHKLLLKPISASIPDEILNDLNLDPDKIHSKIKEMTLKRTKTATSDIKREILEKVANSEPDAKFGRIADDFTIEILLRKLQRRWRAKMNARKGIRDTKRPTYERTNNLLDTLAAASGVKLPRPGSEIEMGVVPTKAPSPADDADDHEL